jgi:hypothetical protein
MTESSLIIVRIIIASDNEVEIIKTYFIFNFFLLRKSFRLRNNVEEFCAPGQDTDDNIIRRMRTARWMIKDTNRLRNT